MPKKIEPHLQEVKKLLIWWMDAQGFNSGDIEKVIRVDRTWAFRLITKKPDWVKIPKIEIAARG